MGAVLCSATGGFDGRLSGGLAAPEAAAVMVAAAAAVASSGVPPAPFRSAACLHRQIRAAARCSRGGHGACELRPAAGAGLQARAGARRGRAPLACCRLPCSPLLRRCAPGRGRSVLGQSPRGGRIDPPGRPFAPGGARHGVWQKPFLSRWARLFATRQVVSKEGWRAGWRRGGGCATAPHPRGCTPTTRASAPVPAPLRVPALKPGAPNVRMLRRAARRGLPGRSYP